jgi:hypothetical protein
LAQVDRLGHQKAPTVFIKEHEFFLALLWQIDIMMNALYRLTLPLKGDVFS